MRIYSQLADAVAVFHAAYVGFVVLGVPAILLGAVLRWRWVRNLWFRVVHLAMIGIVAAEAMLGVTCPLTTLERHWRQLAGQEVGASSFMGRLANNLLFFDAPLWVFTALHIGFAILVLATFVYLPPRWPWNQNEQAMAGRETRGESR